MPNKIKNKPGLFQESLENISRNLFRYHIDIITELISGSSGIYALYDNKKLYYVGRASDLKRRVNQHLRDRHDSQWTHFSLFLIKRAKYIGDIEAMLIRIAEPIGNRARPKRNDSKILVRKLKELIKKKHKEELRELIAGRKNNKASEKPNKSGKNLKSLVKRKRLVKHRGRLIGLVARRTPISTVYKGKEYKAMLTASGKISYNGKSYASPTAAALQIVDTSRVNGWHFWKIKNKNGEWVRLSKY